MTEAKKSLGQHWLEDEGALNAICEAAGVGQDDTVLEIGPGLGSLTELLVQKAREVIAVELDEELAGKLPEKIKAANLQVVSRNILEFDLTELPADYKIVANIPYYLTSKLIRSISETSNRPLVAALLVQKEVAERVAAEPGDMSLLSVSAQFYWEVGRDRVVEAKLFSPPPKVDSQILILKKRKRLLFDVDEKQFFRLVKAGFASRRKTLINSLSGGLRISKSRAGELLERAGIEPGLRPQSISLPRWFELYKAAQTMDIF